MSAEFKKPSPDHPPIDETEQPDQAALDNMEEDGFSEYILVDGKMLPVPGTRVRL